jgi:thiamine biosynthesis lipoprotein
MTGAWLSAALVPRPQPLGPRPQLVERWSWAMGQAVHIMVFAESEDAGLEACAAALAELRRVEDRLSLFADTSDLCELNRCAGKRPMRIDADLENVLRAAEGFRSLTRGAFDPAVEPLMRAWGFHQQRRTAPSPAEIAAAREAVVAAVVRLNGDTASLPSGHTQLDFGGIGVGYGIDRAVAVLRRLGMRRAFIDVSGDCYGLGAPPGQSEGWPVEIAGTSQTIRLRDAALATSANTASVIRWRGRLFGHVMDPATGYPADGTRQVTIVARAATAADALSTARLVNGQGPTSNPFPSYSIGCTIPALSQPSD